MEQEREILDRLAQGDREAFDALYLHYAPKVEELAFWMLKNRTEAEDVMQSIMLKVWERKEEIAQMTRFSNYLFTMTKNAIFDIYNRSLVHEKYESAQLSSVRYFHDDTLDSQVETNDLALLISIAVDKMPDQRRRIFRMSRYEGLSNREIAERLRLSVKAPACLDHAFFLKIVLSGWGFAILSPFYIMSSTPNDEDRQNQQTRPRFSARRYAGGDPTPFPTVDDRPGRPGNEGRSAFSGLEGIARPACGTRLPP